jgi:hypothetical protein
VLRELEALRSMLRESSQPCGGGSAIKSQMALSRRFESAASNGLDKLGTALQAAEAEMDAALCRSGTLAARDTELAALQCSLSLRERELADARMALAEAKRCAAQRDAQVTSQLTDVRAGARAENRHLMRARPQFTVTPIDLMQNRGQNT